MERHIVDGGGADPVWDLVAMSLINQVLNDLEKRGEDAPLREVTIRPVPTRERWNLPGLLTMLILSGVLLLVILGGLKWYLVSHETPVIERAVVTSVPTSGMAPVSSAAVIAVSVPAPVPVITSEVMATDAEAYSSALNMSYELSDVPLPSTLHGKPLLQVAREEQEVTPPEVKKTMPRKAEVSVNRAAEKIKTAPADSPIDLQLKKISPQQHAENEFRKANLAAQEGRTNDALAGYERALSMDPLQHAARRALVGVMLQVKRNADAERILKEGLKRDSHETSFAMLLARLQVERDAIPSALETLQRSLPYAEGQADYHAFVAALLQRQSRHKEAITHFQIALQLTPNTGVWLMGMGISLQAVQRKEDARDAYQRALASNSLNAQLQAFVQKKLKEL